MADNTKDGDHMTCNYFEYKDMTEKMFYGVALTDSHLNNVTEQIRQYIINGGAGEIVKTLNIGIKVITKKALLLQRKLSNVVLYGLMENGREKNLQ